jgi:hypothetical protein
LVTSPDSGRGEVINVGAVDFNLACPYLFEDVAADGRVGFEDLVLGHQFG